MLAAGASLPAQVQTDGTVPPGGGSLKLELRLPKSQFHRGEIIPAELTFSSPEHRKYHIYEDCTPRESYQYNVPPLFDDRLFELDAALAIYMPNCHGGEGEVDPGEKPVVIQQILNERFRMDVAGTYRISVTSNRLGVSLTSNSVQLEILAGDSVWEQAELKRAISLIESRLGSPQWEEGCRVLRFLETEESELEMARREAGPSRCDFDFALISARHRDAVLAELEKGLAEPGRAIAGNYLRTMAFVSLYQQNPEWYPDPSADLGPLQPNTANAFRQPAEESRGLWGPRGLLQDAEWHPDRSPKPRLFEVNRFNGFNRAPRQGSGLGGERGLLQAEQIRYARLLVEALPKKTSQARAKSLQMLLYLGRALPGSQVPPDLLAAVREQMPGAFGGLERYDQGYVLLHEWDGIKGPAMLPVLKDVADRAGWLGPNGIALRRLYELSPEQGRAAILRQLRASSPQGSVEVLGMLPDEQLPELDSIALQRLQASQDGWAQEMAAGLVQRYASPAIAGELRPWFSERIGKLYWGTQVQLLAYFLRVAPADGAEMLRKVMATDGASRPQLGSLAKVRMSPEVEQMAVTELDDARPRIVQEALLVLQEYGSTASRKPLLERFQQWHEAWMSRAKELATDPKAYDQAQIEGLYLNALGTAQSWLTSIGEWRSLRELCVTNYCKENAQRAIETLRWQTSMMIYFSEPSGDAFTESFGVASYHTGNMERLKQKMMQYPKGSFFKLDTRFMEETRVQRIYAELRPWAAEHGLNLQLYREQ